MKNYIILLFVLVNSAAFGQHKINQVLKNQLDSVLVLDQKYRDTLSILMDPAKGDSAAKSLRLTLMDANNHYWGLQNRIDSLNVVFIEGVFTKYGYPGKTLVDTPSNEVAWYIIQHSQKIHQYMPMIKKAANTHELPFRLYAMMLDRDLMNEGKEQIYGTQVTCRFLKKTGKNECFVWPTKDAATVNQRRKKAGLPVTVEENATRLGVVYKVWTLDEIK